MERNLSIRCTPNGKEKRTPSHDTAWCPQAPCKWSGQEMERGVRRAEGSTEMGTARSLQSKNSTGHGRTARAGCAGCPRNSVTLTKSLGPSKLNVFCKIREIKNRHA